MLSFPQALLLLFGRSPGGALWSALQGPNHELPTASSPRRTDSRARLSSATNSSTTKSPNAVPASACFQWTLDVHISENGSVAGFDLVENLLRCFVEGKFMTDWSIDNEDPMYEQAETGFKAVLSSGHICPPATRSRRELKAMTVVLEFAHKITMDYATQQDSFKDTLALADYGISVWMETAKALAPAIFTDKYKRIFELRPLFRPLKTALGLKADHTQLELIAESSFLTGMLGQNNKEQRSNEGVRKSSNNSRKTAKPLAGGNTADLIWESAGQYFHVAPFESRRFIVLSSEQDEIHECVFLNQLLESEL